MDEWFQLSKNKYVKRCEIMALWLYDGANEQAHEGKAVVMIGKDKVIVTELKYEDMKVALGIQDAL